MQSKSITQVSPHFKHSLLAFAVANALSTTSVHAATITVTHEPDNSGVITFPNGGTLDVRCSLREAVQSIEQGSPEPGCINAVSESFGTNDRITSSGALNLVLNRSTVPSENRLTISNNVNIDLAGSTVDADGRSDVFVINGATVTFENTTLTGASGTGQAIAAINAIITVNNSTVRNNPGPGIRTQGGELRLNNSTISGNSGRGVDFAGNILEINNSTLASNDLNLDIKSGSAFLSNSILANAGRTGDCRYSTSEPPVILGRRGSSMIDDGSCGGLASGALTGDPRLEPLANNGGLTQTHALKLGSPARNAGYDNCITTDQRGQARPTSGCDIGAFEFGQLEINVNSHLDDGTGCTLREAIASDTANGCIAIQPEPLFADNTLVTFSSSLQDSIITLDGSPLSLNNNIVEIDASAINGITVDANQQSRVFNIVDSDVLINEVTISGGIANSGAGGGLLTRGSNLYLRNSEIKNNMTQGGRGGGLYQDFGRTVIENSTISGNSAEASNGGGIHVSEGGLLALINSTVSANAALNGGGLSLNSDLVSGNAVLEHTTIANNTASAQGGGLFAESSSFADGEAFLFARNTIIADSSKAADCAFAGQVTIVADASRGNIIQDGSCAGLAVNPRLLPLSDNGGPTPTHALAENSPARKRGVLSRCTEKDQRGFIRTAEDGLCDIGAVEFQNSDVPVNFFTIPLPGGKSVVIPL